jgi:hypothetical protein
MDRAAWSLLWLVVGCAVAIAAVTWTERIGEW